MKAIIFLLEWMVWWLPISMFLAPFIWAIIYHCWYADYKERKEAESWEKIAEFFAKNRDRFPDAASSFQMARFWASPQGHDLMRDMKTKEYYSRMY